MERVQSYELRVRPFSCGWWAVDFDGCVPDIELYGCTGTPDEGVLWTPERQFAEIRRMEDEHPYLRDATIRGWRPGHLGRQPGREICETALKHRLFFEGGQPADTGVDAAALPDEL